MIGKNTSSEQFQESLQYAMQDSGLTSITYDGGSCFIDTNPYTLCFPILTNDGSMVRTIYYTYPEKGVLSHLREKRWWDDQREADFLSCVEWLKENTSVSNLDYESLINY